MRRSIVNNCGSSFEAHLAGIFRNAGIFYLSLFPSLFLSLSLSAYLQHNCWFSVPAQHLVLWASRIGLRHHNTLSRCDHPRGLVHCSPIPHDPVARSRRVTNDFDVAFRLWLCGMCQLGGPPDRQTCPRLRPHSRPRPRPTPSSSRPVNKFNCCLCLLIYKVFTHTHTHRLITISTYST